MGHSITKRGIIKTVIVSVLLCIVIFSGYKIYEIYYGYAKEKEIHDMAMQYKPEEQSPGGTDIPAANQSILDLQEKYPDVVGWLTVPNTKIDYPFVWYEDNDYYLHRDLDGNYAAAGTIFMDFRCSKDFSDFNTIIYGHHMKNQSMFNNIKKFNDKDFFNANKTGTIFLADKTYTLEIFAFIVLEPTDKTVYNTIGAEGGERGAYFDYVKQKARHFRDIGINDDDRVVTLSTCSYEFDNARMVLIARLTEVY